MLDFLIEFFTDYGYTAVFAILILCGFGLPVPEDITLVSGGVISGLDLANPHWMCVVGLAGVLAGDSTMFLLGRIFGYRIQKIKIFRKILPPRRFSQIQQKFKKYGLGLLFVARFLPGLRSPIFLVAGMSRRISYFTFIIMDGIAALISVPIWVYLGFFFADNMDLLIIYVKDVQMAIYLGLGLVIAVVLVLYLKRKFLSKVNVFSRLENLAAQKKKTAGDDITARLQTKLAKELQEPVDNNSGHGAAAAPGASQNQEHNDNSSITSKN